MLIFSLFRLLRVALGERLEPGGEPGEANPNDQVVKIKALEAFAAAANGKATKIIIPSEIQGLAGLAEGIVETVKGPVAEAPEGSPAQAK